MTVILDSNSPSTDISSVNRLSATFAHNSGVSSDRTLVVIVKSHTTNGNVPTVATVTYNGISCIKRIERTFNYTGTRYLGIAVFTLDDPSRNSNNVVVTWNLNVIASEITALTYSGSQGVGANPGSNEGNDANPTLTFTTESATSKTVGGVGTAGHDADPFTAGTGQNELTDGDTGGTGSDDLAYSDSDENSTGGSEVHEYTASTSRQWVIAAVEILRAPIPDQEFGSGEVRITIANPAGTVIGEIDPEIGPVIEVLNDVGSFTFRISKQDPKYRSDLIRIGNRVLIEYSNGLANWAGIISLPIVHNADSVAVPVRSAETIFQDRKTDQTIGFHAANPGSIFERIIRAIEVGTLQNVEIGIVEKDVSIEHDLEFHYQDIFDLFQRLPSEYADRSRFQVTGYRAGGRIVFVANFRDHFGKNRYRTAAVVDGVNLDHVYEIREQGPLYNRVRVVGAGSDWSSDRPVAVAEDPISIQKFGLRESPILFENGITDLTTLQNIAENVLSEYSELLRTYAITVSNNGPGPFRSYGVGDIIRLQLSDGRFGPIDEPVRVLAREYYPETGIAGLLAVSLTNAEKNEPGSGLPVM